MNSTMVKDDGEKKQISLFFEILVEILSRLPTSSLIRFKLVCKLWFSLINNDPVFAKMHIDRGFKSTGPSIIIFSEDCRLILMDDEGYHKYLVFSTEEPLEGISPSCNGVLCIYGNTPTSAILINPTTREELALPNPSDAQHSSKFFVGYIPEIHKFKVVRLFDMPTLCEILMVGTSSWRQITIDCVVSALGYSTTLGGISINGFMYWIVSSWETDTHEIMSLDLNLERFETIKLPEFLEYGDFLSEVEGLLCVTWVGFESAEIWILENLTSHAWVQRYSLRFSCRFYEPIFIHQGKLLVRSNQGLHYHDLKTGRENLVIIYDEKNTDFFDAQGHIESLVSLKDL